MFDFHTLVRVFGHVNITNSVPAVRGIGEGQFGNLQEGRAVQEVVGVLLPGVLSGTVALYAQVPRF